MTYIVEANIGIAFFCLVYKLLLEKETDFSKQRAFLLMSLLFSLLFPLIKFPRGVSIGPVSDALTVLPEVVYGKLTPVAYPVDYLLIMYLGIALIISVPLVIHAVKMISAIKRSRGEYYNNYYVVESNDNEPSWSFFKTIYIGRSNELSNEEKQLVLKHEMLHGKLFHSADMLLITLLCIVFWFNPFVWLYRRTLTKVHEFEVDAMIVEQHNAVDYGVLLAKTALTENGFLLKHHFNQSFILTRINMINMLRNKISNWKFAALALTTMVYFLGVSCTESVDKNSQQAAEPQEFKAREETYKGEVVTAADTPAQHTGGMPGLMEELSANLKYPESAAKKGIEGSVFVEFIVRPDGTLSDFKVLKGLDPDCDAAALTAVSRFKKWTPGSNEGKVVAQRLVLPIKFDLD